MSFWWGNCPCDGHLQGGVWLGFLVAKVDDTSLAIWGKKHSTRHWTGYHASGGNAPLPGPEAGILALWFMNKYRNFTAGGDGRIMLDLSTGSYDLPISIILMITIRPFPRKPSVEEIKLISGTTTASLPTSLRSLRDYPNQREQQEALADVKNVLDNVHPQYPPPPPTHTTNNV